VLVFKHFLVEISVLLQSVLINRPDGLRQIPERGLIIKVQILRVIIGYHPWEDRVLTQIIERPVAQGVHEHQVLEGGDLPEDPHLQDDLLLEDLEAGAVLLQILVGVLSSLEVLEVEENTPPAMLEDLDCGLPELVPIAGDRADLVELDIDPWLQGIDDAPEKKLLGGEGQHPRDGGLRRDVLDLDDQLELQLLLVAALHKALHLEALALLNEIIDPAVGIGGGLDGLVDPVDLLDLIALLVVLEQKHEFTGTLAN